MQLVITACSVRLKGNYSPSFHLVSLAVITDEQIKAFPWMQICNISNMLPKSAPDDGYRMATEK